jgi:hypothetical protein
MTDERLPDSTPEERAFHRLFAEVPPPVTLGRARSAAGPVTRRRRTGRGLRVVFSLAAAALVAAGTFAVLRVAELHRGGAGTTAVPATTASPAPTATPAGCRVPTVEYGNDTSGTPSGGEPWVQSVTAGFTDCRTGVFTVDPTAPTLGPGDHDLIHLPSGGWTEVPAVLAECGQAEPTVDCGWAPDGQEFSYGDQSCTDCQAVAGRVHVVDAQGDHVITPSGETDRVLGWTAEGIVVARIPGPGTTAAGGGRGVFLAGESGADFADYQVNPTTGAETYLATTDAYAAEGGAMWETDGSAALVRYDLSSRSATQWPIPSGSTLCCIRPVGFDGQGDPIIVAADDGPLVAVTGPDQETVLLNGGSEASQWSECLADLPLGGVLILQEDTSSVRNQEMSIHAQLWEPAGGWTDLGADFTVDEAQPVIAVMTNGQYPPMFAGAVLTS